MLLNRKLIYGFYFFISVLMFSCGSSSRIRSIENEVVEELIEEKINILSLGDSYTIGESVCQKCRFPEQLIDSLRQRNTNLDFDLKVIATTGWTTRNLINAIDKRELSTNFDLVTILIGVNNQYQIISFSTFEEEFPLLIQKAIASVNSDKSKLIVLSIPDYAFTPFGSGSTSISKEIQKYNTHIKNFCSSNNITFLNITNITQSGLVNPDYVANDGLHPSKEAYTEFVKLLLPLVTQKLGL